jgi:hypothetical protein
VVLTHDEMVEVAAHIEAFAENDDYTIELRTGLIGTEHVIDSLTVRRKDAAAPGVSPTSLRSLGFGGLLEYAIERATLHYIRDEENEALWHLNPRPPGSAPELARYFIPRKGRRPTPQAQVEAEVRKAADAYNDALHRELHAPVRHVASMLDVSPKTAQRRIRAARELGLIEEGLNP